jgi:hypothetical protein
MPSDVLAYAGGARELTVFHGLFSYFSQPTR